MASTWVYSTTVSAWNLMDNFSKTTNQIFNRNIPVADQRSDQYESYHGTRRQLGYRSQLEYHQHPDKGLQLRGSTLTFYMNRNKLKELYGDGQGMILRTPFLGKSLGAIYGYKNIGIVQEDDTEYIAANGAAPG